MKKIWTFLLVLFIAFSASAQKKLTAQEQLEDFDSLVVALREYHQGTYQYVSREVINQQFDSIRSTMNAKTGLYDFYEVIRYTTALTNEGHTETNLPKKALIRIGLSKSFLPLSTRFCDKELIVTQNYGKDVPLLEKGDQILSVNGKSVADITKDIFPLIPTDGFNQTSRYAWGAGVNFSLLHRLVYGKSKEYILEIEKPGTGEQHTVSIPSIRFTRFKGKNALYAPKHFAYNDFKFELVNDSVAYLSVPGFGNGDMDYAAFYQKSFKQIDSLGIEHLIIDVQANGGGTEGNETLLFSYLSDSVIQKYKRVTMLPKPYGHNKNDAGLIEDKWQIQDTIATRGTYTLYSDYYSDLYYEAPDPELIFHGKVYTLISGTTFSGGAEFASMLKMTNRSLFIGEETGGTYEGNVSGYSETITLPNSKIEIQIPTVHFQINVNPAVRGRGVMPDYEVPETWSDYLQTKNAKKAFTIDLITQKKQESTAKHLR